MIFTLVDRNDKEVIAFLKEHVALSYFILVDYESRVSKISHILYQKINGKIDSVLALRNSGTAHFITSNEFKAHEWSEKFSYIAYKKLIMSENAYISLGGTNFSKTAQIKAYIAEFSKDEKNESFESKHTIAKLTVRDIERLEGLYGKCFASFSPREVTLGRLDGRGQCYGVFADDKLVSSACTDFEYEDQALIVGVCTHPEFRGQAMAMQLVLKCVDDLVSRGLKVQLQYDDYSAGRLYEKAGFRVYQKLVHILKY